MLGNSGLPPVVEAKRALKSVLPLKRELLFVGMGVRLAHNMVSNVDKSPALQL